jgi:hypothetical protein
VPNVLRKEGLEIKHGSTTKDFEKLLIIKNHILMSNALYVSVALKQFLTLPGSVASAERLLSE